jgi:hypothetical protein
MLIKMSIHTGFTGATHEETVEITEKDLEDTTLEEWCEQYLADMLANHIETGWEVVQD